MDGLSRAAGTRWPCKWKGKTYWAEPIRLWVLAACETHILLQRKTLVDQAADASEVVGDRQYLAEEVYKKAYAKMKKDRDSRIVTIDELQKWMCEIEGIAFTMWCLLGKYPKFESLETLQNELMNTEADALRKFCRDRDRASAMDSLANMDWRSPLDLQKLRPPGRTGRSDEKGPKYMPWKRILRELGKEYGWTPEMIMNMTLYQLKVFTTSEEELGGGTASMTPDQAMAFIRQKKAAGD